MAQLLVATGKESRLADESEEGCFRVNECEKSQDPRVSVRSESNPSFASLGISGKSTLSFVCGIRLGSCLIALQGSCGEALCDPISCLVGLGRSY